MNKHIIFTNGRSGSNYLLSLLNSHPHVVNYGEVLGDWTIPQKLHQKVGLGGKDLKSYLNFVYSSKTFFYLAHTYSTYSRLSKGKSPNLKRWSQVKSLGIKDFSFLFKQKHIESFLIERNDIRVVNLYRDNILKRYISLKSLESIGIVKTEKKTSKSLKVKLPVDTLIDDLNDLKAKKNVQLSLAKKISSSRVINIRYEDFFSSKEAREFYQAKIFDFLEVENVCNKVEQRKILPKKLEDVVENFQEVSRLLADTEYERYLL